MGTPTSFRAVYKRIQDQEIDVDIYLPTKQSTNSKKCPVVINIHGGAFMLGSSKMINKDQVADCLSRGWIVVVPNHRLCPQVNILEGPMQDCRDLLAWIHDCGLRKAIWEKQKQDEINDSENLRIEPNLEHVFAFGTSSGGHLALCLGFSVPRPVTGIYAMYPPSNFADPFWTTPPPNMKLPPDISKSLMSKVFDEDPIPIAHGISLEGQAQGPPDFNDPRISYALSQIANGTVLDAIYPANKDFSPIDPVLNISRAFPPTFIVHGVEDTKVPIHLSRSLFAELKEKGARCGMVEIPGEEHTFAAKMQVGSLTWEEQKRGFDFLESLL